MRSYHELLSHLRGTTGVNMFHYARYLKTAGVLPKGVQGRLGDAQVKPVDALALLAAMLSGEGVRNIKAGMDWVCGLKLAGSTAYVFDACGKNHVHHACREDLLETGNVLETFGEMLVNLYRVAAQPVLGEDYRRVIVGGGPGQRFGLIAGDLEPTRYDGSYYREIYWTLDGQLRTSGMNDGPVAPLQHTRFISMAVFEKLAEFFGDAEPSETIRTRQNVIDTELRETLGTCVEGPLYPRKRT